MNKTLIYGVLLAGALLLPKESAELKKLKPVETVSLYIENEQVVVETDTEDIGRGDDVAHALENLKKTTSGTIYLDTADYLLVSKDAANLIPEIAEYLKGSVRVCSAQRAVKVTEAASYLSVHRPDMKLWGYNEKTKLDELCVENGRLILLQKK